MFFFMNLIQVDTSGQPRENSWNSKLNMSLWINKNHPRGRSLHQRSFGVSTCGLDARIGNESVSNNLYMTTSSGDKGFIQISSDQPGIDACPPCALHAAPLPQMNRSAWHYSSGTYRSVDVCIALRQVRATFTGGGCVCVTLIRAHKLKKLPLDNFHLRDIFM